MTESTKPWADGPYKLISPASIGETVSNSKGKGARAMAAHMALVHNLILRGANAVYHQAEEVCGSAGATTNRTPGRGSDVDRADFANFALKWVEMITEHHRTEEEELFPEMEKLAGVEGLMDVNVEEHASFNEGLVDLEAYLRGFVEETRPAGDEQRLDGRRLKEMMDGFMPVLREHLAHEVDNLVQLEKYEDKVDWEDWFTKKGNELMSRAMWSSEYRTTIFPLVFIFHEKAFEDGVWSSFPPAPWIVVAAMRWLFVSKHGAWWRFAGCDYYSERQELPFA